MALRHRLQVRIAGHYNEKPPESNRDSLESATPGLQFKLDTTRENGGNAVADAVPGVRHNISDSWSVTWQGPGHG